MSTYNGDPYIHTNEPIAGVFWLFPVIPVGIAITVFYARRLRRTHAAVSAVGLVMLGVGVLILLAVALPFNSSTMRYTVDFVPLLVLGVVVIVSAVACVVDRQAARVAVLSIWTLAVLIAVAFGVLLVQTPCPGTGSC
jgi:hypothetical protein